MKGSECTNQAPVFFSFFSAITPGQKWWQTVLEIKVPCSKWKAEHGLIRGPSFFFLGRGWGRGIFFLFPLVLIMFHMCSHDIPRVLNLFPQNVPNSTSLLSDMVVQRGASIGECPTFQKNWWWANEYGPFKKRKESVRAPMKCQWPEFWGVGIWGFFVWSSWMFQYLIVFHISVVMWFLSLISRFLFLPLPFSVADLLRHIWDEKESLWLRTGEVCCCWWSWWIGRGDGELLRVESMPYWEGEHIVVVVDVELEECEVFDQTCFVVGEVAAAANPLI